VGGQRACVFYRGLYAQRIAYIEPIGTFAFDISLNVVLMAVIGGPGTWQGPLIGAPLVLLVADALRVTFTSEVNRVIFSLVVILIALFIPGGIMGWLARWRRWRNLAELQGINLAKSSVRKVAGRR
jgi:branched-chain amino acid transport system permease protein